MPAFKGSDPLKLLSGDRESHVGRPLDLRLALRESVIPIGHAGIIADREARGSQVGRHLLARPRADLRLADQAKHEARQEATMSTVVIQNEGGAGSAPVGN